MSLSDRVLYVLSDENKDKPYHQDLLKDIKENISVLLNSKLDDCISSSDMGFPDISFFSIDSKDLCQIIGKEIYNLIKKYENRIKIVSMNYDDSLKPWQLTFDIAYVYETDLFKEFNIRVTFRNNRYCEVL
ncbi:GPW/gp25 family protein [Campylobacter sp. CCUG 57310]|uniref:GPW/gp25 family protein n=1 Tax=Campylobacter sp. CCUG 57310 TaxID=2517362 RepID=UPI001566605A|nr:GPW/gp25 family protein [Campylobacter sp. CCUG 57310]QKF91456.1 type VI secretion system, baseplate protein [Campylobacter sp. CCUG 57310]